MNTNSSTSGFPTAIANTSTEWNCEFTEFEKCDTLNQVKLTFVSLALICNCVTLVILVLLRMYRNFSERIFLYILIPNLIATIASTWNSGYMNNSCIFQAFTFQFTGLCSFLWICVLTIYLAVLIIGGKSNSIDRYERICRVICWAVPLVTAVLPLTTSDYGPAGVYCWITDSTSGVAWRFGTWYIPAIVGSVIILILFIVMYIKLYREYSVLYEYNEHPENRKRQIRMALIPFTAYAATYLVLMTVRFSDRVNDAVTGDHNFSLKIAHRITDSSADLIICAVFYLSHGLKEFTRDKFHQGALYHKESAKNWISGSNDNNIVALNNEPIADGPTEAVETSRAHTEEDFQEIDTTPYRSAA